MQTACCVCCFLNDTVISVRHMTYCQIKSRAFYVNILQSNLPRFNWETQILITTQYNTEDCFCHGIQKIHMWKKVWQCQKVCRCKLRIVRKLVVSSKLWVYIWKLWVYFSHNTRFILCNFDFIYHNSEFILQFRVYIL